MNTMDTTLDQALSEIRLPHAYYNSLCQVLDDIDELNAKMKPKKLELSHAIDALYAALAIEIRKNSPKLSVSLTKNGCIISFKSKSIICKIDCDNKKWDFTENDFGRLFSNRHPEACDLAIDLEDLSKIINDHFSFQYRSL